MFSPERFMEVANEKLSRVNADGTVQNIRAFSNTSNQFLANIAIKAIKSANLPPFPESVVRE